MDTSGRTPTLTTASRAFRVLDPPTSVRGRWRARLLGPGPIRWAAGRAFAPTALRGWEATSFDEQGNGVHVCRRRGVTVQRLRMRAEVRPAIEDGRPATVVRYEPGQSLLWRHVVDEVRAVDDDTLLKVSRLDLPVLRRVGLPVLLEREAAASVRPATARPSHDRPGPPASARPPGR